MGAGAGDWREGFSRSQGCSACVTSGVASCAPATPSVPTAILPLPKPPLSVPLLQGHEKCALMILAETQDLGLINATNSALQM